MYEPARVLPVCRLPMNSCGLRYRWATPCVRGLWELEATAVPAASSAQTGVAAVVTQGIEQRVTVADALTACK